MLEGSETIHLWGTALLESGKNSLAIAQCVVAPHYMPVPLSSKINPTFHSEAFTIPHVTLKKG